MLVAFKEKMPFELVRNIYMYSPLWFVLHICTLVARFWQTVSKNSLSNSKRQMNPAQIAVQTFQSAVLLSL